MPWCSFVLFCFFGVVSVCMFLCLLPCRWVLCFCGGCFGGVLWWGVVCLGSVLGAFLGFWGWFLPVFGVVFWYNGFGWFFGYLALCGK